MRRCLYLIILFLLIACGSGLRPEQDYKWAHISPEADSLTIILDNHRQKIVDSIIIWSRSLEDMPVPSPDARRLLMARGAFFRAKMNVLSNNLDEAENLIGYADSIVPERYVYDSMRINDLAAYIRNSKSGSMFKQYIHLKKSAEQFEKVNDYRIAADNYNFIGILLSKLDENILALDYFRKAEFYYRLSESNYEVRGLQLNIADAMLLLGKTDSARQMLRQLEMDPEIQNDVAFYTNILATIVTLSGDTITSARTKTLAQLDSLYRNSNYKPVTTVVALADYSKDSGDYLKALDYYRTAMPMMNSKQKFTPQMAELLKDMGNCYLHLGMPDSAYHFMSRSMQLRDSIKSSSRISEMHRLSTLSKIHELEQNMQKDEAKRSRIRFTVFTILGCLILLLAVWGYFKHKKEKMSRILQEAENSRLSLHLENERLKANEQRLEIELRNRQLVQNALQLTEKNNTLKEVLGTVKAARDEGNGEVSPEILHKLDAQLAGRIDTEEQWTSFRTCFEEVAPGFYQKLRNRFPALTENEVRLSAFAYLGLPRKQIAFMLNVQPDSVKKAMTRLRKKLGVDAEVPLSEFLHDLIDTES